MSSRPVSLPRLTTPWANGPSKNSGKIVSTWKIIGCQYPGGSNLAVQIWRFKSGGSNLAVQVLQAFGQFYRDAFVGGVDFHADGAREGDQQIAIDYEQARTAAVVP